MCQELSFLWSILAILLKIGVEMCYYIRKRKSGFWVHEQSKSFL